MSAGFIVIGLLCVAVVAAFILVLTNPKFDTASINGGTPKILIWYTPITKPTKRKYIMIWDYGWFRKR